MADVNYTSLKDFYFERKNSNSQYRIKTATQYIITSSNDSHTGYLFDSYCWKTYILPNAGSNKNELIFINNGNGNKLSINTITSYPIVNNECVYIKSIDRELNLVGMTSSASFNYLNSDGSFKPTSLEKNSNINNNITFNISNIEVSTINLESFSKSLGFTYNDTMIKHSKSAYITSSDYTVYATDETIFNEYSSDALFGFDINYHAFDEYYSSGVKIEMTNGITVTIFAPSFNEYGTL